MKVKKITLHKEFKLGLPNFSNVTASAYIEVEPDEKDLTEDGLLKEKMSSKIWSEVDRQLKIQSEKADRGSIGAFFDDNEYDVAKNVICELHKVKLTHTVGEKGEGWGHKLPSGMWCDGKDRKYNKNKEDELPF